jgi:hypothetical protein
MIVLKTFDWGILSALAAEMAWPRDLDRAFYYMRQMRPKEWTVTSMLDRPSIVLGKRFRRREMPYVPEIGKELRPLTEINHE